MIMGIFLVDSFVDSVPKALRVTIGFRKNRAIHGHNIRCGWRMCAGDYRAFLLWGVGLRGVVLRKFIPQLQKLTLNQPDNCKK